MSMMYFTFGVLTVIAMIAIGLIIYSMVRIFKTEKQIKYIQEELQHIIRNSHQEAQWSRDETRNSFRDINQQLDYRLRDIQQQIDECYKSIETKKLIKG